MNQNHFLLIWHLHDNTQFNECYSETTIAPFCNAQSDGHMQKTIQTNVYMTVGRDTVTYLWLGRKEGMRQVANVQHVLIMSDVLENDDTL